MPHTVVQALSLEADDVQRISESYGSSKEWFKVQLAAVVALGFVAILRLGELLALRQEDVMVVFQAPITSLRRIPRLKEIKGLFIHLRWRKASQSHDTWIPVACGLVIRLLMRQVFLLRRDGKTTGPLFTSRTRKGGRRSETNRLGRTAAVEAMRKALQEVCGMTEAQSKLYKGHSLRVGGSNHMRKLGLDDEVHRLMGGWVSLTSSVKYYQLSEDEQLGMAETYALQERMPPTEGGTRPIAIGAVQHITIEG